MKKIFADFNVGQDEDGLMRLTCRGSMLTLLETGAEAGDQVLLSDGEVEVEGIIVERDGLPHARFNWDDIRLV